MYVSYADLKAYSFTDGEDELGSLSDIYFDERDWRLAYWVVETGGWFSSNKVLVAPDSLSGVDTERRHLTTTLSKAEIEAAPQAETKRTVGDLIESTWLLDTDQPVYVAGLPGALLPPSVFQRRIPPTELRTGATWRDPEEAHLRSAEEILDYGIEAEDGRIGSVCDLIFDPDIWKLAYFAVDTGNWLPGRLVVVSPDWATSISWQDKTIQMEVSKERIENGPPLDELKGLEKSYENELYAFYGYPMV